MPLAPYYNGFKPNRHQPTATMKVFLDDVRPTPEGWVRCYWPQEVIELLKTGNVEVISLDHDLGDDTRGTGMDVCKWIEQTVFENGFDGGFIPLLIPLVGKIWSFPLRFSPITLRLRLVPWTRHPGKPTWKGFANMGNKGGIAPWGPRAIIHLSPTTDHTMAQLLAGVVL